MSMPFIFGRIVGRIKKKNAVINFNWNLLWTNEVNIPHGLQFETTNKKEKIGLDVMLVEIIIIFCLFSFG